MPRLPERKTANAIIEIVCGVMIGVGVAMTIIAAIFGVPVWLSVLIGTIFLLLWVATLMFWAVT